MRIHTGRRAVYLAQRPLSTRAVVETNFHHNTMDQIRTAIANARAIVVLTGAGISTDSGIPDFRGPKGVWTKNPQAEKLSDIRHYLADPEVRRLSWQSRLEHPAWQARPNAGHQIGRAHV